MVRARTGSMDGITANAAQRMRCELVYLSMRSKREDEQYSILYRPTPDGRRVGRVASIRFLAEAIHTSR